MNDNEGNVYVVDFQDVKKVDQYGDTKTMATKIANEQWKQANIENQNAVMGLWHDNQGNIYTAIFSNRQVKKFDKNGKEEVILKTSYPWAPSGGMVSTDGEIWVLEASTTNQVRVERIKKDGQRVIY